MAYTLCKKCASRRGCWIRGVMEYRYSPGDPGSLTYKLVLKASRGECLLYTTEDDIMEV